MPASKKTDAILSQKNSGIGLESSILFASEGAHVICADINSAAATRTAALINAVPGNPKALAVIVDVGEEDQIKAMVKTAVDSFGRLDVIFNNAGYVRAFVLTFKPIERKSKDLTHSIQSRSLALVWHGNQDHALSRRRSTEYREQDL